MIEVILYLTLILLGLPAGMILAKLCEEEIPGWKKMFNYMSLISFFSLLVILSTDFEFKIPVATTFAFMMMTFITVTNHPINMNELKKLKRRKKDEKTRI